MRRARVFAAPFVVTAALSGCKKEADEDKPKPRAAPDAARVAVTPPDAAPPIDAFGHPKAPDGATTASFGGAWCKTLPAHDEVACPPEGPTLAFADTALDDVLNGKTDRRIRYDAWKGGCMERQGGCPPREEATCNPPPPKPVACPADALPTLRDGLEPTKRDGDRCYWHAGDVDFEVACPPGLPAAPKGALIYEIDGECFSGSDSADEVRCPKGGAPVIVTPGLEVIQDNHRIYLREPQLLCFAGVLNACPPPKAGEGHSCNPPPPAQVDCPDEILPQLREGAKAKKKDGKCWYDKVQVKCP